MKLLKLLNMLKESIAFLRITFFFFFGLLPQGPKTVVWSRLCMKHKGARFNK